LGFAFNTHQIQFPENKIRAFVFGFFADNDFATIGFAQGFKM
jgi:hypothetical protein